jgi:hypothetical protein
MFDFSLPPVAAVLPVEAHDFLAPSVPNDHLASSLFATAQTNYLPDQDPPPKPTIIIIVSSNAKISPDDGPYPPPTTKMKNDG